MRIKNYIAFLFLVFISHSIKLFAQDEHVIYSSYYGGEGDEMNENVIADHEGNYVLTGVTLSPTHIASQNAYQDSLNDGEDGFIAKFDSNNHLLWSTYFGGSNSSSIKTDEIRGVALDNQNNIIVVGATNSTSGIASSNAYQSTYGGGGSDGFVAKFSSDGNLLWSTYFGGQQYDDFYSVKVTSSGKIITCGESTSPGIATSNAYQTQYAGGQMFGGMLLLLNFPNLEHYFGVRIMEATHQIN